MNNFAIQPISFDANQMNNSSFSSIKEDFNNQNFNTYNDIQNIEHTNAFIPNRFRQPIQTNIENFMSDSSGQSTTQTFNEL